MSVELSIAPGPSILKPVDPQSGQKSRFILFGEDWIELQGYFGAALQLPINQGDFEGKYGKFDGSPTVQGCLGAMKDVQGAAREFGDPRGLRAELIQNPGLLATKQPPEAIFSHIVWMGQRVHSTSARIASGYQSVLDELTDLPAREQVANIKAYLFDRTLGPIPLSQTQSEEIGDLIKKLGKFEQKMNEYNAKMQEFTRNSSTMIGELDKTIGDLAVRIRGLEKDRDEAYQAWKSFTIAAVVASVGCALIGGLLAPFTGGVSLLVGGAAAIATATGLGYKAAESRGKYNEYCKMLGEQNEERKKKQRLRADLGDFDVQMARIGPKMSSFLRSLQTIQGIWSQMNADMIEIGRDVTEDNVGSTKFLVKSNASLAIEAWKAVGEGARQFTANSLVDYTSIPFGQQMPEHITERLAA